MITGTSCPEVLPLSTADLGTAKANTERGSGNRPAAVDALGIYVCGSSPGRTGYRVSVRPLFQGQAHSQAALSRPLDLRTSRWRTPQMGRLKALGPTVASTPLILPTGFYQNPDEHRHREFLECLLRNIGRVPRQVPSVTGVCITRRPSVRMPQSAEAEWKSPRPMASGSRSGSPHASSVRH